MVPEIERWIEYPIEAIMLRTFLSACQAGSEKITEIY